MVSNSEIASILRMTAKVADDDIAQHDLNTLADALDSGSVVSSVEDLIIAYGASGSRITEAYPHIRQLRHDNGIAAPKGTDGAQAISDNYACHEGTTSGGADNSIDLSRWD